MTVALPQQGRYARGNPAGWWKSRRVGWIHRSPAAMFISRSRRAVSLTMLAALSTVIAGGWYLTNPSRISRMADLALTNMLGADVEVGSGRLSFAGTLQLSGVEIKTGQGALRTTLFSADQVEMRFDWLSLLSGQLRVTQVTAIRPTLYLVYDHTTQRWNYERWDRAMAPPDTRPGPDAPPAAPAVPDLPVIVLREAQIQFAESQAGATTDTTSTMVDAQLSPDLQDPSLFRFEVNQRLAAASGLPEQIRGTWDVAAGEFSASAERVVLNNDLKRSLPRLVRQWWDDHAFRGTLAELRFTVTPHDGPLLSVELDRVAMAQVIDENVTGAGKPVTVPFDRVRGTLVFALAKGHVYARNLRGEVMGYAFNADGQFRGTKAEAPFELSLNFHNFVLTDDYPEAFQAFRQARDLIARMKPRGRMGLNLNLARASWGGSVDVDGAVDCKDVKFRFVHFPFPLENVKGKITFNASEVRLHKLTASGDETPIVIDGVCGTVASNRTVDITVSSDNAVFDDRMAACLPEEFQAAWKTFNPTGQGAFTARVQRPNQPNSKQTIRVEVAPTDGTAHMALFPYALHKLNGKLVFTDTAAHLENVSARVGSDLSGTVTFNGTVSYAKGSLHNVDPNVTVTAQNVPLENALLAALPGQRSNWAQWTHVAGRADVALAITRADGPTPHVAGTVKVRDATVEDPAGAWRVADISAEAAVSPDRITLKHLTGRSGPDGKADIALAGTLEGEGDNVRLDVRGKWKNLTLTPEPPTFLPADAQATWKHYKPAGPVDGDMAFRFAGKAVREARPVPPASMPATWVAAATQSAEDGLGLDLRTYFFRLRPAGMSVSPEHWPEALTDMSGELILRPDRMDMRKLTARSGPATLTINGKYLIPADTLDVAITATADSLPQKWFALLPPSAGGFIQSIKPDAKLDIKLRQLKRTTTKDADGEHTLWHFDGDIALDKVKSEGTLQATANSVKLSGKGAWDTRHAGLEYNGALTASDISLYNRTVESFKGKMIGDAKTRTIALNDIDGKAAGGTLQGKITLNLAADPRFEASLLLNDAELAELLLGPNATEEERKKIGTARLTANLAVQEQFGKHAERTGRGELLVRDGTVYNVPLAMGLMQIASLRLPLSGNFEGASMSYYLRDNKITFERILLESKGMNLAGAGTLSLADKSIDMRFVTESPADNTIPLLSPLMRGVRNQLLQIQVSGNIEAPKIQPVPLDAVGSTLQLLIPKKQPDPTP